MLFVEIAEQCYEEGWMDRAGNLTQKGSVALALYETFNYDAGDDDEDFDDLPWEGDSVLFLDEYRLTKETEKPAESRAAPDYLMLPAPAANDEEVVVASSGNESLVAPEGVYCG